MASARLNVAADGAAVTGSGARTAAPVGVAAEPGRRDGHAAPWLDWRSRVALLSYAAILATYFVVRFGSRWAETDSAAFSLIIRAVQREGVLVPSEGYVYPSGYGYQVVYLLLALTGLDVATVQQVALTLLSPLLVLPAWALYRELTGSARAAGLAVLLLFMQAEFLFVSLRGSHERMSRFLMLTALWLLVRSYHYRHRPGWFAAHVLLFYVIAYGLVATNALFGISFIMSIVLAVFAASVVSRLRADGSVVGPVIRRLAWVGLGTACLGFAFVFYVYDPARMSIEALGSVGQRLFALLFTTQATAARPFGYVTVGWVSLPVYFLVSMGTYLLLGASAIIWAYHTLNWLRGVGRPQDWGASILWALYAAFAAQGAFAVVGDLSGELGGNLQVRSFPSFAMLAAPLVASAIAQWHPGRYGKAVAVAMLTVLASLALLKATNEPSLSNKWTFYTPTELQGVDWAVEHQAAGAIWVGFDERLDAAYSVSHGYPPAGVSLDIYAPKQPTRTFLISDVVRMQGARLGQPLPRAVNENRIYDSGEVQVYRLRPETPYQR